MSSLEILPGYRYQRSQPHFLSPTFPISNSQSIAKLKNEITTSRRWSTRRASGRRSAALTATSASRFHPVSASLQELDLTEENVKQVLSDAREKFSHIFDTSVGMTGVAELAELDGPFVKISLKGRFWHERSLILARLGNYLKQRIPEILEVDIEDEKQLDDSPENF